MAGYAGNVIVGFGVGVVVLSVVINVYISYINIVIIYIH